jgi:dihydrofolate reductase
LPASAHARPRISLVAAVAANGVIGRDGRLPWHLPEDLKRFKALTMGHHIVMGRKTYESIGRLLPGRTSVIVTRSRDYAVPGAIVASSLEDAVAQCAGDDEIFVIGGAQIYAAALPSADRLYLTLIHSDVQGEVRFPAWDAQAWVLRSSEALAPEPVSGAAVEYRVYERRREEDQAGD